MLLHSSAVDPNYACPFFCIHGKKPRVTNPQHTKQTGGTYRANELWTRLTNSKLLMASPRNAGVKDMVKSLKCCRFSPRSAPSILLTMFNKATLAQALPAVCPGYQPLIISHKSATRELPYLIGKPKPFGTACLLFFWIILSPAKQEDQAVNGLTEGRVLG